MTLIGTCTMAHGTCIGTRRKKLQVSYQMKSPVKHVFSVHDLLIGLHSLVTLVNDARPEWKRPAAVLVSF